MAPVRVVPVRQPSPANRRARSRPAIDPADPCVDRIGLMRVDRFGPMRLSSQLDWSVGVLLALCVP